MRARFAIVAALMFALSLSLAASGKTFERDLSPGWNFVSLPFAPAENSPVKAFTFFDGAKPAVAGFSVFGLENGRYAEGALLTENRAGRGYLVYVNSSYKLIAEGSDAPAAPVSIPLKKGWNLVGSPFSAALPWDGNVTVDGASITNAALKIDPVLYSYDAALDRYVAVTLFSGQLEPWKAYFVRAKQDCTLGFSQVGKTGRKDVVSVEVEGQGAQRAVSGQVVAWAGSGAAATALAAKAEQISGRIVEQNAALGLYLVELPAGADAAKAAAALAQADGVSGAVPNIVFSLMDLVPSDPPFASGVPDAQRWGFEKISAPRAWDATQTVSTPVVAVLDTGVDASSPDLAGRVLPGASFTGQSATTDGNGHGTHVAGIIAAAGNNGAGIAGVCWNCRVLPVQVCDADGVCPLFSVLEGLAYAADQGARVINVSLSGYAPAGTSARKVFQAATDYAASKGSLVVGAAGNTGADAGSTVPGGLAGVLSVTATDVADGRAAFANYGADVDLAAPGVDIFSLVPDGATGAKSGTSAAAAFVSGAAGFLMARKPGMSAAEITDALKSGADPVALSPAIGGGRLNLAKAFGAIAQVNHAPEISGCFFTPGGVPADEASVAVLECSVTDSDGNLSSVNADLSIIGGQAAAPLADAGGGVWRLGGITVTKSVTPGQYTVVLSARDKEGAVGAGQAILGVGQVAPPEAQATGTFTTASSGNTPCVTNWPDFHCNANNTGEGGTALSLPMAMKWNFAEGEPVMSSPAVNNGRVFIGTGNAGVDKRIYALEAMTGAKLWEFMTGGSVKSTPSVSNGRVFAGSSDHRMYALNETTGAYLWSYPTGGGIESSAVVSNGRVIFGSNDGSVYALDETTGAFLWSYAAGGQITSSPAAADGKVFFGSSNNTVYAVNETSGAFVWSYPTGGPVTSSPAVANGRVFVGSQDGKVYALDETTGAFIWQYVTGAQVLSSPAAANAKVYVTTWNHNAVALDETSGAVVWTRNVGDAVVSSPAAVDGKLMLGTMDKYVMALDAANGTILWSYRVDGAVTSSPGVANNKVYIASQGGKVYCFEMNLPPQANNVIFTPGSLVADGHATSTVTARVIEPNGLSDVATVTVDLSPLGGGAAVIMFDDGLHGDGAAGDGLFGALDVSAATSTALGAHTITVRVTDFGGEMGTSNGTIIITGNTPPTVLSCAFLPTDLVANGLDTASLTCVVTDAESNLKSVTVNLMLLGGPAHADLSNAGGNMWLRDGITAPVGTSAGPYSMTVTAEDFMSATGSAQADLNVVNPDLCPGWRVTNLADSGNGTLRWCITKADITPGDNVIDIDPSVRNHVTTLASDLPAIADTTGSTTIENLTDGYFTVNGANLGLTCFKITSSNNMIRRLKITGCGTGVLVDGAGASGNKIAANTFENNVVGVKVSSAAGNNTIGTPAAGDRNIFTSNTQKGIWIKDAGSDGNKIIGNYIFNTAAGDGIRIEQQAKNTLIGGAATENERNVISGNSGSGIAMDSLAEGTAITGNYIGIDASGTLAVGNVTGISISGGARNNVIGSDFSHRNTISENGTGISISGAGTDGNIVIANYIGMDPYGGYGMGNAGAGISFGWAAGNPKHNIIGGAASWEPNIIAYNGAGITSGGAGTDYNTYTKNRIFANVPGKGINNGGAANAGIQPPVITAAARTGAIFDVSGTLACPAFPCAVELFRVDDSVALVDEDPSGSGEAFEYLGTAPVAAGAAFSFAGVPISLNGKQVTATLTDANGNTSEFGLNFDLPVDTCPGRQVTTDADSGIGSLRACITEANAATGTDDISFATSMSGHTILLLSQLPAISDATGETKIRNLTGGEIRVSGGGGGFDCFVITSKYNQIENLSIIKCGGAGIRLSGAGANHNKIFGDFIGTDISLSAGLGNYYGVVMDSGANNNVIGDLDHYAKNYVERNASAAVYITGAGTDVNVVVGGYIRHNGSGVLIGGGARFNEVGGGSDVTDFERNTIFGNTAWGVSMQDAGTSGNKIRGNDIWSNHEGVYIAGADGNTVGGSKFTGTRNSIDTCTGKGVWIYGGSDNTIAGNDISGNDAGVFLSDDGTNGAKNNIIGSLVFNESNVINGNAADGVHISGTGSDGNTVINNYIGVDNGGNSAVPNLTGIFVGGGAKNNVIGGSALGTGNLVSGNTTGVALTGAGTSNNIVSSNRIGLNGNATGTAPNGVGVDISAGASSNTIGGSTWDEINYISGSTQYGVHVRDAGTDGNRITGNSIGTGPDGGLPAGNGTYAVFVELGARGNKIGGTALAGEANLIKFNGAGIYITGANSDFNTVSRNRIYNNTGLGLDIGATGPGPGGNGANGDIAAPVITSAVLDGSVYDIGGTAACPAAPCTVELFRVDDSLEMVTADPSGYGEAFEYVASTAVAAGAFSFSNLAISASGTKVTATVTDANGNTSELASNSLLPPNLCPDFIVTANADSGLGSLRACMDKANFTGGANTITFDSAMAGKTIMLASALPDLTDMTGGTTIVNTSGGYVAVSGNNGSFDCFTVKSAGNEIHGLTVISCWGSGNTTHAIMIDGPTAAGNKVTGCYIGTNAASDVNINNGNGIEISDGASNNTIGGTTVADRNVISTNVNAGILITGNGSINNIIKGNYIGTNPSGAGQSTNLSGTGILIAGGANHNTVGGATAGERNIISGNIINVYIGGDGSNDNKVTGNYIGPDVTGSYAISNSSVGVKIEWDAKNNIVGGTTAGERNIISGNLLNPGVIIYHSGTENNKIIGNYIGLNATGTVPLPNGSGIEIREAGSNIIGGAAAGEKNIISGNNGIGIRIFGAGADANSILGNNIGTNVSGTVGMANASGGIRIDTGAKNNRVGSAAGPNLIAFNGGPGVFVTDTDSDGNTISRNKIYFNGPGLGIDVGAAGTGTGGNGANADIPAPVIATVVDNSGVYDIDGTAACPAYPCTVELFRVDDSVTGVTPDPSGAGEGFEYVTSAAVAAGAAFSFSGQAISANSSLITVTLTDANGGTSEFSANYFLHTVNYTPSVTLVTFTPGTMPADGITTGKVTALVVDADGPADIATVTVDLTLIGGGAAVAMYDDGLHGDGAAGDGTFGATGFTVNASTAAGTYSMPVTASDQHGASASDTGNLTVTVPGADVCVNDWPDYHCNARNTGEGGSAILLPLSVRWSFAEGEPVWSSPSVANGKVYVGTGTNGADKRIYSLDADTGAKLWEYTTGNSILSTPSVANGRVFAGSYDGKLYALDANTGAFLWSYPTGGGVDSSPAVSGGKVIFGSADGRVYALNETNGAFIWSYTTGGQVTSSPAVDGGKVFFGSYDKKVYAVNENNGTLAWSYMTGDKVTSSPAVTNGRVFIGSWDKSVYALDENSGGWLWQYYTGAPVYSSPAAVNGRVYVTTYGDSAVALNEVTGAVVWNRSGLGAMLSAPAIVDGKVIFGTFNKYVYALQETTGGVLWRYRLPGAISASPAVAGGMVYISGQDGKTYCLEPNKPPQVSNVIFNPNTLLADGHATTTVTATVSDPNGLDDVNTVTMDLTAAGGSAAVPLYDDGLHGDGASGDGVFGATGITAASSTAAGALTLTVTATDMAVATGTANGVLTIIANSPPVVSACSFLPGSVRANGADTTTLTCTVTDPDNNIASVTVDLSLIGGSAVAALADMGGGAWTLAGITASAGTAAATYTLAITASDYAPATGTMTADLGVTIATLCAGWKVINNNDSGIGSLRQCMTEANGAGGGKTITFDSPLAGGQTITLASALPPITSNGNTITNSGLEVAVSGAGGGFGCFTITSANNVLRGLTIVQCSGAGAAGVTITGAAATENVVESSNIGTNAAGQTGLGNGGGVIIAGGASGNRVGGTGAGQGNVIGGNTFGIKITGAGTTGNVIIGNYVGANATGLAGIANTSDGIFIEAGASANRVGGAAAGEPNVVAFNGANGIRVSQATAMRNTLSENRIYSNASLGIGLESGANINIAAPAITWAALIAGNYDVSGTIACPAAPCTVELFRADDSVAGVSPDPSGWGEGFEFISAATTAGPAFSFTGVSISTDSTMITATLRDANGNTSEFGLNYTLPTTPLNFAPVVTNVTLNPGTMPNSVSTNVAVKATVTDANGLADVAGVTLDLSSLGGSAAAAMFDDGLHGDGAAADGVFGTSFTVAMGTAVGGYVVAVTATDLQGATGTGTGNLSVLNATSGAFIQACAAEPQDHWLPHNNPGMMNMPRDAAVDELGNIIAADTSNNRISIFDKNCGFVRMWGTIGSGNGYLRQPTGIIYNPVNQYVYVADYFDRVQMFTMTGAFMGKMLVAKPTSVAADPEGNIYVTSKNYGLVSEFTAAGALVATWTVATPYGIDLDSSGNIVVTSSSLNAIVKIDKTTGVQTVIGGPGTGPGQFGDPRGLAISRLTGDIYVAEYGNNRVQRLTPSGVPVAMFNDYGGGDGQVNYPEGVTLTNEDHLLIVDTLNSRVEELSP